MRPALEASFGAALAATDPAALTAAHLPDERPAFVLAVGKAAVPMARAAAERFEGVRGLVVTRDGYGGAAGDLEVREAAHPVPDERSTAAAEEALARVGALGDDELLLVLISGGGSALLCSPWGVTLAQKREASEALLRSGAAIGEINAVRKHLSRVKGGQLAGATAARVRTLVLSDVPGDDLAVVASGPTVADPSTFAGALGVLDRYALALPGVRAHLGRGVRGELEETPKPGDTRLARVENRIVGSGYELLAAAAAYWETNGLGGQAGAPTVAVLSDCFGGEARELAGFHADVVRSIRRHGVPFRPPVVLLSGGEASVTVRGDRPGGRNQEFALWLAHHLGHDGVWAITCDSDGIDGSTEAAGAVVSPDTLARASALGLDVAGALAGNDAHAVLAALGDLVVTGPTRQNLNDYRAIVVA